MIARGEQPRVTNVEEIAVFGGELIQKPLWLKVFVMNSKAEIGEAYRDYFAGKYGETNPEKGSV